MVKRTHFEDYRDAYANFAFELSEEGILLMRQHTDGGSLVWNAESHDELVDALSDVAGDRDIRVLILTGTGENFNADWGFLAKGAEGSEAPDEDFKPPVDWVDNLAWHGLQRTYNLLNIDVPMIAAVNGPCNMHSEVPLFCDVVLASEDTWFDDAPHYPRGVVPGDGQHIIWNSLIGPNRASYFLLTDQRITAQQALEWGVVNEVLPKHKVLERAYEIARQIAKRPPMATRYTRRLIARNKRRMVLNELEVGQMYELYAMRQFYPSVGGQKPITNDWDSDNPFDL